MAVGLGRMFGFEFMKNFDSPYRAESITDFWRRWHISLSTFLRDYLYIPLGGNQRGTARTYLNLAVVMLFGGLWHGANWTFIVWGAYHGMLLIAERWAGRKPAYRKFPRPLRIAFTFVLVLGSWVWFRAESLPAALAYFAAMFGGSPTETTALLGAQLYAPGKAALMAIAAILLCTPFQAHDWSENVTWPKAILAPPVFATAVLVHVLPGSQPVPLFPILMNTQHHPLLVIVAFPGDARLPAVRARSSSRHGAANGRPRCEVFTQPPTPENLRAYEKALARRRA